MMFTRCTCDDCGETVLINTLASGSCGNKHIASISYCTCYDREANPEKKIQGLVRFEREIKPQRHLAAVTKD